MCNNNRKLVTFDKKSQMEEHFDRISEENYERIDREVMSSIKKEKKNYRYRDKYVQDVDDLLSTAIDSIKTAANILIDKDHHHSAIIGREMLDLVKPDEEGHRPALLKFRREVSQLSPLVFNNIDKIAQYERKPRFFYAIFHILECLIVGALVGCTVAAIFKLITT